MASIDPYTISVPDSELERLTQKLSFASFPDEIEDANWDYGAPLADIKRLTQYWKDEFDWKKQESEINKLPNFRTSIEVDGFGSLDIHFVHQKSNVENAIPLLFSHGCPLSYPLLHEPVTNNLQGLEISSKFPNSLRLSMAMEKTRPPSTLSLPLFQISVSRRASQRRGSVCLSMQRLLTS